MSDGVMARGGERDHRDDGCLFGFVTIGATLWLARWALLRVTR